MKITAIKQQVKRPDRYSIFVDGKYSFSLSEAGLLEQRLASGQELDAARLAELTAASGADKAYGNALRYVAMRPRSEWEVYSYLQRKQAEEPVIEHIMQRLTRVQLIDDVAFARMWIANRRLLKNTSKRKLELELKFKRVPEDIIRTALSEDVVSEGDALQALIEKKRGRYPDRTKFMQYLARQGFTYDDIKHALSESTDD